MSDTNPTQAELDAAKAKQAELDARRERAAAVPNQDIPVDPIATGTPSLPTPVAPVSETGLVAVTVTKNGERVRTGAVLPADVGAVSVPESLRGSKQAELDSLRTQIVAARERRDAAIREMTELEAEEAELGAELAVADGETSDRKTQLAIQDHLASQRGARDGRHARRQAALATGVTPEDLRGQSAIDAAHQRHTARGTQRPDFHQPKA